MSVPKWPDRLVKWFEKGHRPMPWRSDPSPYKVWISEVMLQQTQVATVIPYFDRFVDRFAGFEELAGATVEDVLRCWEGLGYYSRARNLQAAARKIVGDFGGVPPHTSDELREFPGVGAYTAAAIASIAFGEAVPAVDGNVLRVFSRFWGLETALRDAALADEIRRRLTPVIRRVNPSHFNQAIMETGALICRPKNPKCELCVLAGRCVARRTGRTKDLPVVHVARAVPNHEEVAGVVWKAGRVLIVRCPARGLLGGLWVFPGGRCKRGEDLTRTLERKVLEATGLRVLAGGHVLELRHAYSHFCVNLTVLRCRWVEGRVRLNSSVGFRWIRPGEAVNYPMSRVYRKVADALCNGPAWVKRFPQTIEVAKMVAKC